MSVTRAKGGLLETSHIPTLVDKREIIYVEFEDGDRRNPLDYSLFKKWAITLSACYLSAMTGAAASSYPISTPSLIHDLHCTELEAALGLSLYAIGFSLVPLVTSSLSEEIGRRPLYIFSSTMWTLTHVMIALAPNIGVVLAGRALGGIFGSIGAANVGGTIADIWRPQDRGFPMALYAFTHLFSTGLGSVIGGVIQSNLGWRWVQWVHVTFSFPFVVLMLLVMSETRSSIILIQIAKSLRKASGNISYKAQAEIDKESLWSMIKTSCTRPLYLLLTEPIVISFSAWCGFTWGVVYCLLEAVTPMFRAIYGFDVEQTGYVYISTSIGATIGFLANLYNDKLYRRHFHRRHQEARLYLACVAAVCLPVGMFLFAWTTSSRVHWTVPIIGLSVFMSGVMVIFLVAFLYLADCYDIYASSAQAGQNLTRNLMGAAFPLFTRQLFAALTYKWALTLFAVLALVLAPIPFVLFFHGSKIRARSIVSRKILEKNLQTPHPSSVSLSSSGTEKSDV